jgi:hypothetical protein
MNTVVVTGQPGSAEKNLVRRAEFGLHVIEPDGFAVAQLQKWITFPA